ncbi:hypothetical protein MHYP_G00184910 [Metynnis hypsauchen]
MPSGCKLFCARRRDVSHRFIIYRFIKGNKVGGEKGAPERRVLGHEVGWSRKHVHGLRRNPLDKLRSDSCLWETICMESDLQAEAGRLPQTGM